MDRDAKLTLNELFEAVELPQMEEDSKRGPPHPSKPLLNSLILNPFGIASERELARELKMIPSLGEDCGFEGGKTPSQRP